MKIMSVKWTCMYLQEFYKLVLYKNGKCKVLRYVIENYERDSTKASYSVLKTITRYEERPIQLLINELLEEMKNERE